MVRNYAGHCEAILAHAMGTYISIFKKWPFIVVDFFRWKIQDVCLVGRAF